MLRCQCLSKEARRWHRNVLKSSMAVHFSYRYDHNNFLLYVLQNVDCPEWRVHGVDFQIVNAFAGRVIFGETPNRAELVRLELDFEIRSHLRQRIGPSETKPNSTAVRPYGVHLPYGGFMPSFSSKDFWASGFRQMSGHI